MANEYDERMQQLRQEDDAANYSQKYIYKDVPPEDNPAAADLEHRLSEKVTSFTSPLTTNADLLASQDYLTRIVVVGPDGLNRVFLKNNKTGETYAVTGHPKYAPTKEEEADAAFFRKQRADLAEVDAMMEESVQELVKEEGMSLAEAMEAAKRKAAAEEEEAEGPKKLSPGKAKFKAGERTTHFADWETEGMTEEELKQIGAHPSQLETLPAIEVEQTRERFEEPKLTDEQRELARKVVDAETAEERPWFETDPDDWNSAETRYTTPIAEGDIEEGDTGAWDSDEQEAFEPLEKIEAPDVRFKTKRPAYIEKRSGYSITHKER